MTMNRTQKDLLTTHHGVGNDFVNVRIGKSMDRGGIVLLKR